MSHTVLSLALRWAAPPLVGALIGWAVVFVGLRVGFLRRSSRGRRAAAAGLGRLVATRFLSEAAVRAQIRSPAIVEQISRGVASLSAQVLETPVAKLLQTGAPATPISLSGIVEALLKRFLGSRALIYTIRDLAKRLVDSLSGRKLQEILSRFDIMELVSERVLALLAVPEKRRAVARSLAEAVGQSGGVLSDDALDKAASFLEPSLPLAAERVIEWLKSAETRAYLSEQGRDLLPRILEKLNLLQRFLLSAGQFDRRLTEKMPEIVDETIATLQGTLRDSTQQRRVTRALLEAARDWRDGMASGNREKSIDSIAGIIDSLLARLEDPAVRKSFVTLLEKRLLAADPTLGGIARQVTGKRDDEMVESVSAWALTLLTRRESVEAVSRGATALVDGMRAEDTGTIGGLLGMDEKRKAGIDAFLTERIVDTLDQRLPEMLRGMNVGKLVAEKIEGLDARDARRPMRAVAGVGALVGLLIGIVELFLGMVL